MIQAMKKNLLIVVGKNYEMKLEKRKEKKKGKNETAPPLQLSVLYISSVWYNLTCRIRNFHDSAYLAHYFSLSSWKNNFKNQIIYLFF